MKNLLHVSREALHTFILSMDWENCHRFFLFLIITACCCIPFLWCISAREGNGVKFYGKDAVLIYSNANLMSGRVWRGRHVYWCNIWGRDCQMQKDCVWPFLPAEQGYIAFSYDFTLSLLIHKSRTVIKQVVVHDTCWLSIVIILIYIFSSSLLNWYFKVFMFSSINS